MPNEVNFSPFNFRAVTFLDLLQQIEQNPLFTGKPQWLKILLAGKQDILLSYVDARANDNMFHSMYTKQNVFNFANYLGYSPRLRSAATGQLKVTIDPSVSLPVTIPKAELLFSTSETVGGAPVKFTGIQDETFNTYEKIISVMEGEIFTDAPSSALQGKAFEEIAIERNNVVANSISLKINNLTWDFIASILEAGPTDRKFTVINKDVGVFLRCGDNVTGLVFPSGYIPQITARYGGGSRGNVKAGKIDTYVGPSTYIESVINDEATSGGASEESIDSVKLYAPLSVIAQGRAVTSEDFRFFSETYGGVAKAKVESNYYGPGSARIQIVPNGGGNPSQLLKDNLTQFLKDKSLLSNINVQCVDPFYLPIDIEIEVQVTNGVLFSEVKDFVEIASILCVSETTKELREIWKAEGIASLITNINSFFGMSFDSTDPFTQTQIEKIIFVVSEREWGKNIFSNIFFSVMDQIDGVDFITLILPIDNTFVDTFQLPTLGSLLVTSKNLPERSSSDELFFTDFTDNNMTMDSSYFDSLALTSSSDAVIL